MQYFMQHHEITVIIINGQGVHFFLCDSILYSVGFSVLVVVGVDKVQSRDLCISKENYYMKKRSDCKMRRARGDI